MLDPRSTPRFMRPGALNLLFPHWGFELELNPRRSMVRKARAWLAKGFNAIVAHHGHTPRALYAEPGRDFGPAALVVDSLGDFVCGFPQEWYSYGMVLKVGLGVDSSGRAAIGRVRWEFCETRPSGGIVMTRLRPDLSPEALYGSLSHAARMVG